jgi:uncharacterized protein DUF6159
VGRITRGWELSKKSFALVEHDRGLLLFPTLSILATIAAALVIFGPTFAWWQISGGDLPLIVGGVLGFYTLNVISTFFGVAFIAVARRSLNGEPWTMSDGWWAASSRFGSILAWALVATIVGLLLQGLERVRGGFFVNVIARWVIGAAWSLATFFIVPVLAVEGGSPFEAAKRSVQIVRKRWGEGVVGTTAIGGLYVIVVFSAGVPFVLGVAAYSSAPLLSFLLIMIAIAIVAVGTVVNSAVSQLFRFVLYEYAVSDRALGSFTAGDLDTSFTPRRRFLGR